MYTYHAEFMLLVPIVNILGFSTIAGILKDGIGLACKDT